MELKDFVNQLRALGITRISLELGAPVVPLEEPSGFDVDPIGEPKPPNACCEPSCNAPRGYTLAPEYCDVHGQIALGIESRGGRLI